MRVNAYAAPAAGEPLARVTIDRREVGPNDVLIQIEYAGICHSDIHTVNGDWGPQPFPVVPGHEIVGLVTDVGSDVNRHHVGDRVGVGCMVNSCGECVNCRAGDEQYCVKGNIGTYAATDVDGTTTQGGYSTHVVVDADFVLRIPEGIDPAAAAPLLCAGITTYAPLQALERRSGPTGRGRRPRRSRSHGGQDRPRSGRRGHRALPVAEEAGGRASPRSRPLLRDRGPGDIRAARQPVRPHPQHGECPHRPRRLPRATRGRRHPRQRRCPAGAAEPSTSSRSSAAVARSPAR